MTQPAISKIVAQSTKIASHDLLDFRQAYVETLKDGQSSLDQEYTGLLRLMEGVCSFLLQPSSELPFAPMAEMLGRRTMIPDDLSEDQLNTLKDISVQAVPAALKARICDTLWVSRRDYKAAQSAVPAYLEAAKALIKEHWPLSQDYATRAAVIARQLGGDSNEMTFVEQWVQERLNEVLANPDIGDSGYWPLAVIEITVERVESADFRYLGDRSLDLGEKRRDPHSRSAYFDLAAKAFARAGDGAKRADAFARKGRTWQDAADAFRTPEGGDGMQIAHRLEMALEAYRNAGEKEKAECVLIQLQEANKLTISQMQPVQVKVDVQPLVSGATSRMEGKIGDDAIRQFVDLVRPPNAAAAKAQSEQERSDFPLPDLAQQKILTPEGNVAVARNGQLPGEVDNDRIALSAHYNSKRTIAATVIETGRCEIMKDAEARWVDSVARLIERSRFVAANQQDLLLRALKAGIEGDLVGFVHLAIPQIEAIARAIVADAGGKTTSLRDGIMREIDLNQMLKRESGGFGILRKVLGDDLAWDMRMLLVEQAGPNIRNRVCHGLMSSDECTSPHVTYLLWQTLYLLKVTSS